MNVKQVDLVKILGVTRQTIYGLERDGVITKETDGSYDLAKNVQSYVAFKSENSEEKDKTLIEAKRRKENALAEIQELNLAEKKGELIDRQTVINDIQKILTNMRQKLLSLSGRLSGDILNIKNRAVAQKILEDAFKNILLELSELETYTENTETKKTKK